MVPELNEFAGLPMAAENPPNVTPAVKPSATTAASAAASPRRSAMTCLVSRISPPTASGLPHLHDGGGPHPRAPLECPPGMSEYCGALSIRDNGPTSEFAKQVPPNSLGRSSPPDQVQPRPARQRPL